MRQSPTPLEILRTDQGLSQRALAKKAGISPQVIINIETGRKRDYRRLNLVKIARALDVTVEDLFPNGKEEEAS